MNRIWNRIPKWNRTRILLVVCGTLMLTVGLAYQRWDGARNDLLVQERAIKDALRQESSEMPLSNTPDGVVRFLETGKLVYEPIFFLHPDRIRNPERFHIRVYPRITNDRHDGWVGEHGGRWYVKLL